MERYLIAEHGFELIAGLIGEAERSELLEAVGAVDGPHVVTGPIASLPSLAVLAPVASIVMPPVVRVDTRSFIVSA